MRGTARKGKTRRDAAQAAQEGRASRHEKDSERAQNKKRFRKAQERPEQEEMPPREHERSFSLHSHLALHFRCLM